MYVKSKNIPLFAIGAQSVALASRERVPWVSTKGFSIKCGPNKTKYKTGHEKSKCDVWLAFPTDFTSWNYEYE